MVMAAAKYLGLRGQIARFFLTAFPLLQVILHVREGDQVWLVLGAGTSLNYGTVPSVISFSGHILWRDDD